MDDVNRAEYETQSTQLRADLKLWENDWAKTHNGQKPGREDIKANPDIARKYKQYNKVRDILSGKAPPPAKEDPKPRKRKSDIHLAQTPTKRNKNFETPSKNRNVDHDDDLMNSPAISRKLFSPASVTSLGPTPQRDGRVLGLFDLLVEKELRTPSRKDSPRKPGSQRRLDATPSKRSAAMDDELTAKLGRTPVSSSKRKMLNSFMTPQKNRDGNPDAVTPSSVSKLQFDTPAFLKRHSLPALDENGEFDAPAPLRLPRKPMVRGLSEIVASLRKVEEDHLDDELDALREIEDEELGISRPKPAGMYDNPDEGIMGRDGNSNSLRVFKKKGQKRTTRRSNMKPTRTKRPENMGEAQESGDEENEGAIPETQKEAGDEDVSDFEDVDVVENKKTKKVKKAKKPATKPAGTVKKAARKVNELAHANFQRLKLKNTGTKGGPGFGSRFRRRR
ncbi:DNA replication/checkpoint protein [Dactylonectria estremocensis]|uniref:DNA replication regulator SLD2 n=1 Tax=Dactylonectria estremocensis TaxID=1079267 RepID=A0A9P9JAN8_9HYPO|nr:DNA replication/checkpoint protein [Dactylonectria estremocensis]